MNGYRHSRRQHPSPSLFFRRRASASPAAASAFGSWPRDSRSSDVSLTGTHQVYFSHLKTRQPSTGSMISTTIWFVLRAKRATRSLRAQHPPRTHLFLFHPRADGAHLLPQLLPHLLAPILCLCNLLCRWSLVQMFLHRSNGLMAYGSSR